MLAHTVKMLEGDQQGDQTSVEATSPTEEWKQEAFNEMNKNVAAQDVVAVPKTYKVVMIRHGESEWNKDNKFCGWYDSGLSEKGMEIKRSIALCHQNWKLLWCTQQGRVTR